MMAENGSDETRTQPGRRRTKNQPKEKTIVTLLLIIIMGVHFFITL
jgi:hypothetical protein